MGDVKDFFISLPGRVVDLFEWIDASAVRTVYATWAVMLVTVALAWWLFYVLTRRDRLARLFRMIRVRMRPRPYSRRVRRVRKKNARSIMTEADSPDDPQ